MICLAVVELDSWNIYPDDKAVRTKTWTEQPLLYATILKYEGHSTPFRVTRWSSVANYLGPQAIMSSRRCLEAFAIRKRSKIIDGH